MGTELIADAWLADWASTQGREGTAARRLLRAQILTYNRTGHLLALNDEYVRRRVVHSARYGQTPRLWVRCLRCGWQANLNDWCKAAEFSGQARAELILRMYDANQPERSAFLRACPGEQYLRDMAVLASLPRIRQEGLDT